tara:strand:+ start:283 stop:918 length:636 start_codon:yes stop_codon:yes gene_type:complete
MNRGDLRSCNIDGKEYACFMINKRSSHWISEDAEVRRLFHDTEKWSDIIVPRCNGDGVMCTTHNLRLERALALGWHIERQGKKAVMKRTKDGLTKDNVTWNGVENNKKNREDYIPPSVQKAVDVAIKYGDIKYVIRECIVKEATAWNYLATGSALVHNAHELRRLVMDVAPHYDALKDKSGSLTELVNRLPPDVASIPFVMNKLRILRCIN